MKNLNRVALLAVVVSSLAFAEEGASEGSGMHRPGFLLDRAEHSRDMMLDLHVTLPYGHFFFGGFGIGVGGVFYIPLVKDGFIPPLNDEFGIDFGADVVLYPGYVSGIFSLTIPVTVVWTFHITDTFSAYAKAGIALRIWPGSLYAIYPDPVGAAGINYMLSKSFGLRAEVGYPGIKVGILLTF